MLVGTAQFATAAILLAATHPERTQALVLINAFARIVRTPDYPAGVPTAVVESFFEGLVDPEAPQTDDVPLMAPSLAHDDSFRAWWRRAGHRGASPAMAMAVWRMLLDCDVRALLGDLAVPALVVHARDNAYIRVGHGRYLAGHIPGARYVELATADHVPGLALRHRRGSRRVLDRDPSCARFRIGRWPPYCSLTLSVRPSGRRCSGTGPGESDSIDTTRWPNARSGALPGGW